MVLVNTLDVTTIPLNNRMATLHQTIKLIFLGQLKCARQIILPKEFSDPTLQYVTTQTQSKFLRQKYPISSPADKQFDPPRETLNFEESTKAIVFLKPRVVPGPCGLRDNLLTVLLFNEQSSLIPKAKQVIIKLSMLATDIVSRNLLWYFYDAWMSINLTTMNNRDFFGSPTR